MLKISCPNCKVEIKLGKPKQGKFAPTCTSCSKKFQLLIKEMPDKSFRHKVGLMPSAGTRSKKSDASAASTKTGADPKDATAVTVNSTSQPKPPNKLPPEKKKPSKASAQIPNETVFAADNQTTGPIDDDSFKTNLTQKPERTAASKSQTKPVAKLPKRKRGDPASGKLGGYRLIELLGEGGMGSVYLANQTTLDRNVALKVVRERLAKHASMLARFTREAYAAAQLVHPNVVQIYDMGDDNGSCFFSMELVDGQSLHEYVAEKKKVDPEQASKFILQAARGLQCAHNAGMVHRDIKPANLLVNKDGLVKVADLGLVKVPDQDEIEDDVREMSALSASQDLTRVGTTIGTPYYMAPEQAKSAITADHRADIYSLGCTFYVLLTGKRPFEGNSIEEVVSKHTLEPIVMPSMIVERVPEELSAVVAKMMEKRPEDRYQTMDELIKDLENYLGLASTEAFTPDEVDADTIEASASSFNGSPLLKIRPFIPLALFAGSLLFVIVLAFVGQWRWATGFLLLPIAASITYFVFAGMKEDGHLFNQARELVLKSGILAWVKWAFAGLLLVAASFLTGTLLQWIVLGGLGAGLGLAYYFLIDKKIASTRVQAVGDAEKLIRKMRLKGMDEGTIQTFVAKYCGKNWEEFFESLFGYPTKRKVRDEIKNAGASKRKPKFRAWRDAIHDNLQNRLSTIDSAEDEKHLQKIEQAGLVAQGVSPEEAREQASQMAAALVDHGESVRVEALQKRLIEQDPELQRLQKRMKIKSMLAEARSGKYKREQTALQKIEPVLNRIFGSYARFLLGCCLIVGSLLWARQNDLFTAEKLAATTQSIVSLAGGESDSASTDVADSLKPNANGGSEKKTQPKTQSRTQPTNQAKTQPLSLPFVGSMFFNFNTLIAGLILVFSTIVFGWRMAIFVLPAAAITIWGSSFGIPDIQLFENVHAVSALIGVGIFMAGVVFGRSDA
jgi:serine/threonine protein kinase/transposase-like protein